MRPSFGARPTKDGVSFRLWAPGARRVDLLLERRHAMQRRQDGWYVTEIAGLRAGRDYKFRIDDEIDVPDPASTGLTSASSARTSAVVRPGPGRWMPS